MKRVALTVFCLLSLSAGSFIYWQHSLHKRIGTLHLHEVVAKGDAIGDERPALPFFELMVPLPLQPGLKYIPQLEYRKGPPKRFLSKISFLLVPEGEEKAKEQIVYFGRRKQSGDRIDWARYLLQKPELPHAEFLEQAIRYAAKGELPKDIPWHYRPALQIIYLDYLKSVFDGSTTDVYIMTQSETPAFLFYPRHRELIGQRAEVWFYRRDVRYEYHMRSKKQFSAIDPVDLFTHTFLVSKRRDAVSFIANELSDINLRSDALSSLALEDLQWPLLLLGAKLSVDPASIHAFFHFAGLNALLYNSTRGKSDDLDVIDSFRNNVLVADRYGKDIAPESRQSNEMSRLARTLIDML